MGFMLYLSDLSWSFTTICALLAFVALSSLVIDYGFMLNLRRKMPPGPFPWPIVGNTYQLPGAKPWLLMESLSKKYESPLITFWIGRNPTVWINDAVSASELLDKRAGIYSSRPRMVVFGELGVTQANIVAQYYGDRWRVHRKLTHMGVGSQHVRSYAEFQANESRIVALDILRNPEGFVDHFERYAASVVSIIGFSRRISHALDPIISEVIAVMQKGAELNVPGRTFPMIMETFPILAKFPTVIAPWKKALGDGAGRGREFYYAIAEEAAALGEDNYSRKILKERLKYQLSKAEIAALVGNLFGAGSDTSSSTLLTFVLGCCAFPEVLPKAWEELDRVVGPHRSPTIEDLVNLPYIRAFVKEVFRWRSVAIIGGQPHAPIQNDTYRGWLIPKGTWVQGNVWAIHHNERHFPQPDRFCPERFFENHPLYRPFPNERGYMTFGWGRRVCSGQALAEQGTLLNVARLLWAFDIQPALDDNHQHIPMDIFAYTNGLNIRPEPFQCRFIPRSDEIRRTVLLEGELALKELARYDRSTKYRMQMFDKDDAFFEQVKHKQTV